MDPIQEISRILKDNSILRLKVAELLWGDALNDEEMYEVAEEVCENVFGPRIECLSCTAGSMVFPETECYECGQIVRIEYKIGPSK